MNCTVKKIAYFAMDVANRPGEAAGVLQTLSQAEVNLLAFSGFPRGRRAQLDLVPEDAALFRKVMNKAKLKTRPKKTAFLVQGVDRAGAVAEVLQKLADAGIDVTAIEAVSAGTDRYGAILWVKPPDVRKAGKVFQVV
jgi:hypothetical protein